MRGKVGHAADGIALYFDVRTKHLANERLETAELDNEQLILGCNMFNIRDIMSERPNPLFTAKLPRAALAARWTSVS